VYESASRSDNADLDPLVQQVTDVLRTGRAGIVTDIDGTISPIVARPDEGFVLPEARRALTSLRDLVAVVAVVTGRSVVDARAMVGVEGLTYVGNHGLEVWTEHGPELVAEARPWVPRVAAVLDEVARRLELGTLSDADVADVPSHPDEPPTLSGVIIENKGVTASLHYRLAPDRERARRELLEILARYAVTSGLRVEEGRMVMNLLPPLSVTKGSAITWLVREHRLNSIVYLGDDNTDAHAFRALVMLRQSEGVQALGIGVVGPETPPSVRQLVDASVPTVDAVAELLCGVVDRLRSSATMESRAPTVGST